MAIICRPDHPLAGQHSAPLVAIAGERFIAFEEGLAIREAIDRALQRADCEANVALEFDNVETMKRSIEAGDGVSILPEPSVQREISLGSLAKVSIAGDPIVRPLAIVHRRDRQLSELAKQFIGLLKAEADFAAAAPVQESAVYQANGVHVL